MSDRIIRVNIISGNWAALSGIGSRSLGDYSAKSLSTMTQQELTDSELDAKVILEEYGESNPSVLYLAGLVKDVSADDANDEELALWLRSAATKNLQPIGAMEGRGFPDANRAVNSKGEEHNPFDRPNFGFPMGTLLIYRYLHMMDQAKKWSEVPGFKGVPVGSEFSDNAGNVDPDVIGYTFGLDMSEGDVWDPTNPVGVAKYITYNGTSFDYQLGQEDFPLARAFMRNYYGHTAMTAHDMFPVRTLSPIDKDRLPQTMGTFSASLVFGKHSTNTIHFKPDGAYRHSYLFIEFRKSAVQYPYITLMEQYHQYRLRIAKIWSDLFHNWVETGKKLTYQIPSAGTGTGIVKELAWWFWYSIYDPMMLEKNKTQQFIQEDFASPAFGKISLGERGHNVKIRGAAIFPFTEHIINNTTNPGFQTDDWNQGPTGWVIPNINWHSSQTLSILGPVGKATSGKTQKELQTSTPSDGIESNDVRTSFGYYDISDKSGTANPKEHSKYVNTRGRNQNNNAVSAFIRAVLNVYEADQWGNKTAEQYWQKVYRYVRQLSVKKSRLMYRHSVKGTGTHQDARPWYIRFPADQGGVQPGWWGYNKPWTRVITKKFHVPSVSFSSGQMTNLIASYNIANMYDGASQFTSGTDGMNRITRESKIFPLWLDCWDNMSRMWGRTNEDSGWGPWISRAKFSGGRALGWELVTGYDYASPDGHGQPDGGGGTRAGIDNLLYDSPNIWGEGYQSVIDLLAKEIYRHIGDKNKIQWKTYDGDEAGGGNEGDSQTFTFTAGVDTVSTIANTLRQNKSDIWKGINWYRHISGKTGEKAWKELFQAVSMKDTQVSNYINAAYTQSLGENAVDWRKFIEDTYKDYVTLWKDWSSTKNYIDLNTRKWDIRYTSSAETNWTQRGQSALNYLANPTTLNLEGSKANNWYTYRWSPPFFDPTGDGGQPQGSMMRFFYDNTPGVNKFDAQLYTAARGDHKKETFYVIDRWGNRMPDMSSDNAEYPETCHAYAGNSYLATNTTNNWGTTSFKFLKDNWPSSGARSWSDYQNQGVPGSETGLDCNFWNRGFTEDFQKTWGDKIVIPDTDSSNDQVLNEVAASTAVQIVAALGKVGTQNYLNTLMAAYLYDGKVDKDDFDLAENNATAAIPALASPELQTYVLTEDEVERRQDFFEQCALLMTMEKFTAAHKKRIVKEMINKVEGNQKLVTPHFNYPYNKRFWMLEDISRNPAHKTYDKYTDQNGMINKFFIPYNMDEFMNIPPSVAAMLVPKLRISKVYEESQFKNSGRKNAVEVEFEFGQTGLGGGLESGAGTTPVERINDMFARSNVIDRGNGAGIKSFDFAFEGTSPATARNDITAQLVLYFQNFNDFFRERVNSKGLNFSFVDMILYPGKKVGYGKASKNQYDPSYYRIRADVGWQLPDAGIAAEIDKIMGSGSSDKLSRQIRQINKSFYLNMVDHDIDVKEDGSVEIKISYRAYLESLMKTTRMDALESIDIRKDREDKEQKLNEARKKRCPQTEIMSLKNEFLKQEKILTALSQQSIMQRLFDRQRVYWAELNEGSKRQFEVNGFFTTRPYFFDRYKLGQLAAKRKFGASNKRSQQKAYAQLVRTNLDDKDGLINFNFVEDDIGKNQRIHYFFMGDLVHTILDCVYGLDNGKGSYDMNQYRDPSVQNIRLLLGSFDYYDFDGNRHVANIANIPISAHYFIEWFTQNVVKPKRTGYPVMYFIRDLCNQLVGSLFGNLCRRTPLERRIRFNTANFIAPGTHVGTDNRNRALYVDRFQQMCAKYEKGKGWRNKNTNVVINVHNNYVSKNAALPLMSTAGNYLPIADNYNYLLIYSHQTPTITHPGEGNMADDKFRGVQHFHIGSRAGITKKINFAKTDIQYIRESRFLNHGDQGLLQLGAVYKATIQTIGNTIWYPGMEVYINPLGLGGTEFGYPQKIGSRANALGIGGYHIVTRVKSSIAPGKFNTTIEAQFHYSGAPQDAGQQLGVGYEDTTGERNLEAKSISQNAVCKEFLQEAHEQTVDLHNQAGISNIED